MRNSCAASSPQSKQRTEVWTAATPLLELVCCYLISPQWSKKDEIQWRFKFRVKGIVLTWCISGKDRMLPFHRHHSTYPHTHTDQNLPRQTSTTRTKAQLQQKHHCNAHSSETWSSVEPLIVYKPTIRVNNCLFLLPRVLFQSLFSLPSCSHLASANST